MKAPLIWIAAPLFFSLIAFLFRKNRMFVIYFGGGLFAFLAVLAMTVRIDSIFPMGPAKIEIESTLTVFGRSFILADGDRSLIALLFGIGAIWFFGSRISATNTFFVPNGMAVISLLIAAMSVQPFLYAALIVTLAVLISIPMLVTPGKKIENGIYRYLIFQVLAAPFILLAGWGFEQALITADSQRIYMLSAFLLAFGFSMWLAIFPFYTWVPLLAEAGHPYVAGFIFATIPTTAQLMLVDFVNNYTWLRNETVINNVAQVIATLMIVISGLWSIYQKSILRLFGYLVLVEIGFAIMSFSLNSHLGWEAYFSALLPRIVAIALCSMAISIWRTENIQLNLDSMKGLFYRQPVSVLAFLIGWFSMSGMPLFSSFPIRMGVLVQLSQANLNIAVWSLFGMFSLFFASFRLISIFFSRTSETTLKVGETSLQSIFLGIGSFVLISMGLIPNLYVRIFLTTLSVYKNLP